MLVPMVMVACWEEDIWCRVRYSTCGALRRYATFQTEAPHIVSRLSRRTTWERDNLKRNPQAQGCTLTVEPCGGEWNKPRATAVPPGDEKVGEIPAVKQWPRGCIKPVPILLYLYDSLMFFASVSLAKTHRTK